jgi:hypothetical protein
MIVLAPVFLAFIVLGKADLGITVCIVLGMILLAIRFHWDLRKYVWFWATIVCVFALHIPLFFWVGSLQGNVPVRLLGIADFFIIVVIVEIADRFFSRDWPNTPITLNIRKGPPA